MKDRHRSRHYGTLRATTSRAEAHHRRQFITNASSTARLEATDGIREFHAIEVYGSTLSLYRDEYSAELFSMLLERCAPDSADEVLESSCAGPTHSTAPATTTDQDADALTVDAATFGVSAVPLLWR